MHIITRLYKAFCLVAVSKVGSNDPIRILSSYNGTSKNKNLIPCFVACDKSLKMLSVDLLCLFISVLIVCLDFTILKL